MTAEDNTPSDERMAALFAAASGDAPPPDEDFLRRLRAESTEVFAAGSETVAGDCPDFRPETGRKASQSPASHESAVPQPSKRSKMVLYLRRAAALACAGTVAAVAWFFSAGQGGEQPTLGEALDQLARAKSYHLKIDSSGKPTEAWARAPGQLRWDLPDGAYRIARDGRVWTVDEKANRAASKPAEFVQGEGTGVHPLALLLSANLLGGLDEKGYQAVLGARPAKRVVSEGTDCVFYSVLVPVEQGQVMVQALVEARTGSLKSLEVKSGRDGKFASLAAVEVVAVDGPVPEELFVVGETLTEDGRAGKLVDAQGLCAIRPAHAQRWTPAGEGALVMPGDWLRADLRGANALVARLAGDTDLTLGPGALVEVVRPGRLRVFSGEVKVAAAGRTPVEVVGPDEQPVKVSGVQLFRIEREKLARLDRDPAWLESFEGRAKGEPIGSLVANIDGRNTPLAVGYHKVTVDVRDQIARTVVEESFVNHTAGRLEGVFHFPLPQDASISGFGMWIGGELVEADVVEKQRAREIYETILREKRDPGLLEWTGGNIFKARVFPIEPHSEKRIKITYTQVLPLEGGSFRYSYALQSELLKQHPLRELAITVSIHSATPLRSVTSPTHAVRAQMAAHSARLEFAAQEYTPTRDFEVVAEVDSRQAHVVMVPHRRSDDGYFMLLVHPPGFEADAPRAVVPEGEPLELLVLADTSASLDRSARAAQGEFIAAVLGSLGPKDRLNLACLDVECDWAFEGFVPAEEKNVAAAREFLARRTSLGWTDLDRAFAAAFAKAGPKTRIIYVGDGIPATVESDPVAFAGRLKKLYEGQSWGGGGGQSPFSPSAKMGTVPAPASKMGTVPACYAVSVGSSFESGVLRAIAACGGGTVRQIGGERGPKTVARELLAEIARPALKDLRVEFRGLRVARVYPRELPNLPAGQQQIILGRYLPEGKDQSGEVVVSGTLEGKPVRFATPVSLKDAEQGNSFIPRLWARMHLDELLAQGASQAIQDEIIALSEEYHIITPYTSLLVLESDADRERFKVKRRFLMRDGERFFAEGRDSVDFDLVQQQMRQAGLWRLGLRRMVLAQLAGLGRDARLFEMRDSIVVAGRVRGSSFGGLGGLGGLAFSDGEWGGMTLWNGRDAYGMHGDKPQGMSGPVSRTESIEWSMMDREPALEQVLEDAKKLDFDEDALSLKEMVAGKPLGEVWEEKSSAAEEFSARKNLNFSRAPSLLEPALLHGLAMDLKGRGFAYDGPMPLYVHYPIQRVDVGGGGWFAGGYDLPGNRPWGGPYYDLSSLVHLFPALPGPPEAIKPPKPAKPWPAEARALAEGLVRTGVPAKLEGGLRIGRVVESSDPRFGEPTGRATTLALVGPKNWLARTEGPGQQTLVSWCDGRERGVMGLGLRLGRVRPAVPADLDARAMGLPLEGFMLTPLDQTQAGSDVEVQEQAPDRALVRVTWPDQPGRETRYLVDTARRVVLSVEHLRDGKPNGATRYGDFVEAAGVWWPTRAEALDAKGRPFSRTTWQVALLKPGEQAAQLQTQLAPRAQVQLLREPLPSVAKAKRAAAAGKAGFEDRFVLMLHFAAIQQWTRAEEQLLRAEEAGADKPGMKWVRNAFLDLARRREELRARIMEEAGRLAKPQAAQDELFLARRLAGQASGALEANEMLRLLDVLRPVHERQPAFTRAMRDWGRDRVNYLRQTGQAQEALALLGKLAGDWPHDYSLQQEYAQALAGVGEHDAAYKLLRELVGGPMEWHPHEIDSLRNTWCQLLEDQGRWAEAAELLAGWTEQAPENSSVCDRYLGALVRLDRVEEADRLAARWLKEGQVPERLAPDALARLSAAVRFMLGQSGHFHRDRLEEKWLRPLGDAALDFARHEHHASVADQIMNEWRFNQTDEARRVRRAALEILQAEADTLAPEALHRLMGWAMGGEPAVEQPVWRKLAERLRARWRAEKDPEKKHALAAPLAQVLSGRLTPEERLGFFREQHQQGPAQYRAQYAGQLFDALLAVEWSAEAEDEALALMDKLSDADDAAARLATHLAALYRFTDRMVQARYEHAMKAVEHPEELTRTELRDKQIEAQKKAREGLADRLRKEAAKRQGRLAQWLTAERLYLDVQAGRNLAQAAGECWEILLPSPAGRGASDLPSPSGRGVWGEGRSPTESPPTGEGSPHPNPLPEGEGTRFLDEALRVRALVTLANLAARKGAQPETADRLLKHLDARIAATDDPDDLRWQTVKYQLLVALDRPKELESELRRWAAAEGAVGRWRLSLGYLLAEQGKLTEAIPLFEAVAGADELGPAEYRTLADWYMAAGRREDHDKARIAAYKMIEEWRLRNLLAQRLGPWQRRDGAVPAELDKEVLLVFAALFEKSSSPQQHLGYLQQFYRETRDFRLLAGLADAVVGHTAGKVYPFLHAMAPVLGEVHDEATADSIVEHLAKVRARAKTPVDLRALDLLEALVERRAAEVHNQPGPHVEKALGAMQRALKREWTEGEPRLMADFLAGLGRITQPKLAAEQVRQLEALYGRAARGTADRLHVGLRLANAHWDYARHEAAIDLLEIELREFEQAQGGSLPQEANDALSAFVSYLESRGRHARGEQALLDQLKRPVNAQQKRWLLERLYELYERAVRDGAEISLGGGATLYRAAAAAVEAALATVDPKHRSNLLVRLCNLYRAAQEKKLPGAANDLRAFALERFDGVAQRDLNNYPSMVSTVAHSVRELCGLRDGLAFLIGQIEREPRWVRYSNQEGWRQHGDTLAQWRAECREPLGELAPRLLALAIEELRQDLLTRQGRNRSMYHRHHGYYWTEKEADFARAAEEVYARKKDSGPAVAYIAEYLYHGVDRRDRAIEVLTIAWRAGLLEESAQEQLVRYLHECERHGESIAVLLPLVERRPDNVQYRVYLMRAYYKTKQPAQLAACLKQADEHFRKGGRWTEGAMAALAQSCLDSELWSAAVKYYGEVIPLNQRTQPNRGIGGGTLSQYYTDLARAHAGLKQTAQAVEAACGAVVSWGPRHDCRAEALRALGDVLRQSPDLDAYAAALDEETGKTGLDSPIVRKALGQIYLERKEYAKAVRQLKAAVQAQPNDAETHQALVACYDAQGDRQGAIARLLESLQLARREIKLYEDLGNRYAQLERPGEAERAYTSIVEMLPAESEGHAALAQVRQRQDRWRDAIAHWRQVARIRALEPTGLIGLAEAQIRERLWDEADATVRELESRAWPSRFSDAESKTRELRARVKQGRQE